MRAFAFASAASLALAACAAPPTPPASEGRPQRVVSLNLCTDELLLLLADPEQIASVSHLAREEAESPLWQAARSYAANDGTLAAAAALRPDLVLTIGGGGADQPWIAERLGIRLVDLPFPQSLDDIVGSIRTVASVLGQPHRGEALVGRIEALRRTAPAQATETLWLGNGGRTASATGLQAEWMNLAGLRQRQVAGDLIQLEDLLLDPPEILLRTDYRADEYSRAQAWLVHPLARARGSIRDIRTDGRRWLCMGPLLIEEIGRLRRERGS
jgi:iron complex transport system substrate-binding protein